MSNKKKVKHMTETEQKKEKKSIIGVIDLSSPAESQMSVATSAARIANATGLTLKLYPKNKGRNTIDTLWVEEIERSIRNRYATLQVSICEPGFFQFFPSINSIAKKQHAAMIVIGDTPEFHKDMWRITKDSILPVLLLPDEYEFTKLSTISIAIDMDRNVQKIKAVIMLAKAFNASVNIFMDRPKTANEQLVLNNVFLFFGKRLQKAGIAFQTEMVRKQTKFITRFCKYTAKHADVAVMEIPEGSIQDEVEQNIETLMSLPKSTAKNSPKRRPVLIIKTKIDASRINWRY